MPVKRAAALDLSAFPAESVKHTTRRICLACVLVLFGFRNFSDVAQRRILSALRFLPEARYARIEAMLAAFVQGMSSILRRLTMLALRLSVTYFRSALTVG